MIIDITRDRNRGNMKRGKVQAGETIDVGGMIEGVDKGRQYIHLSNPHTYLSFPPYKKLRIAFTKQRSV